ncbi:MAG TPA: hypothetical protein VK936_11270 [Longimicrobiales bacterium]|nr:hypothetical protein [Longimicrobiales bacterium]
MRRQFEADGDTWLVTRDEHDRRRAVHTIVFHCTSNSQRPYRVIEVPEDALNGKEPADLSIEEIGDLFAGTHTMDYSHDRDAAPATSPTAKRR